MLDTASAMLADATARIGVEVVYSRGVGDGSFTVELSAVLGSSDFERVDSNGVQSVTETRDFIVAATDLVNGSTPIVPLAGDTITQTTPTGTAEFRVLAVGGSTPWRWSDPQQRLRRIHTKQVGEGSS